MLVSGPKEIVEKFMCISMRTDEEVPAEFILPDGEFPFFFNNTLPIVDNEDWYNQRTGLWGTKWDAQTAFDCESYTDSYSHSEISFRFDTAWGPPCEWICTVSKDFPELEFSIYYNEPGMNFEGLYRVQDMVVSRDESRELLSIWS